MGDADGERNAAGRTRREGQVGGATSDPRCVPFADRASPFQPARWNPFTISRSV